mgnify:CR=1 FL=1
MLCEHLYGIVLYLVVCMSVILFIYIFFLFLFFFFFCVCFFFQAEDGIRYLVRSRGLGDVYKRQLQKSGMDITLAKELGLVRADGLDFTANANGATASPDGYITVSYTHLTLPTSDLV